MGKINQLNRLKILTFFGSRLEYGIIVVGLQAIHQR